MLKISYTTKLFFNQYAYCVTVKQLVPKWMWPGCTDKKQFPVYQWASENLITGFKVKSYWTDTKYNKHIYYQKIYLSNEKQKNDVITQFGSDVVEVCEPYNEEHREALDLKTTIVVRDKPIYNKFFHVVYFKADRDNAINEWISEYFDIENNKSVSHKRYYYWSRLYMPNDEHLAVIRLTWGEHISEIKSVLIPHDSVDQPTTSS